MIKTFTCDEFIKFTQSESEKNNWLYYCEIIILDNGKIMLARPSHQLAVEKYFFETQNEMNYDEFNEIMLEYVLSPTDFIIDKLGIICVWYDYIRASNHRGINRFQFITLKKLDKAGLINFNNVLSTSEYHFYLNRKKGETKNDK